MNKKLISAITLSAILIVPTNILAKTFSDVNNNDWFYSVVNELSDKGIISGYEDNTFKPQKSVSYAEFLTLLNNSIGEKQTPDYKNSEEWYKPTFDYLKQKGVITNIQNPNAKITRNEMAKYLSLGLEKLKNQKIDTTTPASIKDFDSIPNEYKDLVASVVNAGLIKGDENQNFNGSKSLTRAETAVIIKGLGGEGKPVEKAKKAHPNAKLLVHPECAAAVTKNADYIGSTTGIMSYAKKSTDKEFIIGTENSIVSHLQYECPDKLFYPLSKDCVCHNMKLTTLVDVYNCLKGLAGEEIILPEEVSKGAKRCIDRMLELN